MKRVFVDTSVLLRYYYAILFSQSLSTALLCWGLLLNIIFSFSSARCIRWPGFALIRLSCRCLIDVMLLHCVCCTRLIRTRIIVCLVSFHLLLSKFDIIELAVYSWFLLLLCFYVFRGAGASGVAKQFINNFVFPTWVCAVCFCNNNNNEKTVKLIQIVRLLSAFTTSPAVTRPNNSARYTIFKSYIPW